jgi:hypothetical protein
MVLGRPRRTRAKDVGVALSLPASALQHLDALAGRFGCSRAALIRRLVLLALAAESTAIGFGPDGTLEHVEEST